MQARATDSCVANVLADAFNVREAWARALLVELAATDSATAGTVAVKIGFKSRFALAHRLRCAALPPLTDLRAMMRVLTWTQHWKVEGTTLARQAFREGRDPAVCYRMVRRVTGRGWRDFRGAEFAAVAVELATRSRGGSAT